MNRNRERRTRIGVESLEGRKLTATVDYFLHVEGIDGEATSTRPPATVQVGTAFASLTVGGQSR